MFWDYGLVKNLRMGSLPNLDQVHLRLRQSKMIANQRRRLYLSISPSGSTWWVLNNRMCNWLLHPVLALAVSPRLPSVMKTYFESTFKDSPQLLRLGVAWVLNLQVPPLRYNLLGSERSLRISPSRAGPPLLDLRNFSKILLLFLVRIDTEVVHGSHVV